MSSTEPLPAPPLQPLPQPAGIPLPWFLALVSAFLLAAFFGIRLVNDSDLGFHLRTGQWILQNHRIPSGDEFTYTASSRDYVDMEWLYQAAAYLFFRLGSYSLLTLIHLALALLALLLLWVRLQETRVPSWTSVPLLATAVLACEPRFRVRPEVLTWVLLGLTLWILELRFKRQRDLLFFLPFLQLLWVNTEGLFFLGPAMIAFYLLSGLAASSKPDPKLLRYGALAVGACLINPYFIRGALFPFEFLSTLGASDIYRHRVQEFQPPWSLTPAPWAPVPFYLWAYKGFSFLLLAALLATARRRKIHEWLLAAFFFCLSIVAVRNIPLFLFACVPLVAACWKDLRGAWFQKRADSFLSHSWTAWCLALFLLGFSARVATNAHYVANRLTDRFGLGLDLDAQPASACRFLTENGLDGRILNDLDDGDWLDWLVPQKTFIDGRLELMGRDLRDRYVRSQAPGGLETLLVQYRPDILFFNPLVVPQWAADLGGMADWRLVYLDPQAAIFLRKGYAAGVPTLNFGDLLSQNGVSPSTPAQAGEELGQDPPSVWNTYWKGFLQPVDYPNNLLNLGIFSSYLGEPRASEAFFLEALRRTQGRYPDFYYDLGLLYASEGRRDEAVLCMRRVLKDKPGDPMARQIAGLPSQP